MIRQPVKRDILHIDMDAFYASVECIDKPELAGKPVIVGGKCNRGVVSAASYAAREHGIHSAMPVFKARQLCPDGIFLPVRMQRYKQVAMQIMKILRGYSPLMEQASVDEAYLDITGTSKLFGSPEIVAKNIKHNIFEKIGLTCSVGIASNKFLAKIASDLKKPGGLVQIDDAEVTEFMRTLPVGKIPGVGSRTLEILHSYGVETGSDILKFSEKFWTDRFGKAGRILFDHAKGIDNIPVVSISRPKSFSAEVTLFNNTSSLPELKNYLFNQAERVCRDLRKHEYGGRTITLKVKFADFKLLTRSRSLPFHTSSTVIVFEMASVLLDEMNLNRRIRLIGLGVSKLTRGARQIVLFGDKKNEKQEKLDQVIDKIHKAFGQEIINRGAGFKMFNSVRGQGKQKKYF